MSFVVTSEVGRNFDIRSSSKMGDRERSKMVFGEWGVEGRMSGYLGTFNWVAESIRLSWENTEIQRR